MTNMSNFLLVDLCHKSDISNGFFFSVKQCSTHAAIFTENFSASANSMAETMLILKLFLTKAKQNKA